MMQEKNKNSSLDKDFLVRIHVNVVLRRIDSLRESRAKEKRLILKR